MDTKKLRQKILDLAIRGKLVPQDPNDEPASVLLERIRAEKERLIKEGKIKRSKKVAADDEIEAPFEIPESWEWTDVGEIASSILYGVSESAKEKGKYKLLRITDIQDNKVNWESVPFTDFDDNKVQAYLLQDGDILFARTGATVGKSYLVKDLFQPAIYASYLIRVQTSSVILPSYIKFFFESGYYWEQISLSSVGIGQPNVNGTTLAGLSIPIPPYYEQKRIVNEVERWLALIDTLESNKGDLLKAIDKAKSKILDLAIHGKLVPQDPNDEPAIELLKRILEEKKQLVRDGRLKKKDLEGKPISEDEISFRIPESWEWVRLKSVTSKIVDGDHNPPHGQPNDSGYYMLSSKNIINDSIGILEDVRFLSYDDWKKCNERTNLTNGDVLLTTVATLGRSCVYENDVPYCFQRSVSVISTLICNYFLKFCFDSPYYQSLIDDKATGTAQRGFYINQLEESIIPIPPLSEQKRIVAKIEELFAVLDIIKESLE